MNRTENGSGIYTLRRILILLQLVFFAFALLYVGRSLFIPMMFGLFIAIVMYPVCKWLEVKHVSKAAAISISLGFVVILFFCLISLLGWQLSLFRQDIPYLVLKIKPLLLELQNWVIERFGITAAVQDEWLRTTVMNGSGDIGHWLSITFSSTANILFSLFLVPIYAALFLYHRRMFVAVLHKLVGSRLQIQVGHILDKIIHTYFSYIKGMVMVYIIVGILNSLGLLALGIKHAILFGMLTAIMTIIPYVGIIISALLPISVAFITTDSILYPAGVILVFSFVQYLEANIIFPKVVSTQLNVSTWATLVGIIAGGIVWGVSGMVLFIPFVAILKIVTDHIREWQALNLLLSRHE